MIKKLERSKGNVLAIEAAGTITLEEIKSIVPTFEDAIVEYGKIILLAVLKTTKYSSLQAMYEDMSWGLKYLKHSGKMAVVGDKNGSSY